MKHCFTNAGVKTADWWIAFNNGLFRAKHADVETPQAELPYPIVAKSHYGSKGMGNTLIESAEALREWMIGKNLNKYIFEKYVNFHKEFRIHCSTNGIFCAFRKLRKEGTERWFFNTNNCVFKTVDLETIKDSPFWKNVEEDLIKALKELKLDLAGFDVRINRDYTDFSIIESNSAPGLLNIGTQAYYNEIIKLFKQKCNDDNTN